MNYTTALIQLPLLVKENKGARIVTPLDVAMLCSDMGEFAQESFQVLTLNSKNKLVNRHLVTLGLADASLVHPREVFRPAILDNASAVVLVHNHPSGDPQASMEDIRITRQLIAAGKLLDIKVVDHIIIGDEHSSLRESGLVKFD